jgi:hypothetical protein
VLKMSEFGRPVFINIFIVVSLILLHMLFQQKCKQRGRVSAVGTAPGRIDKLAVAELLTSYLSSHQRLIIRTLTSIVKNNYNRLGIEEGMIDVDCGAN